MEYQTKRIRTLYHPDVQNNMNFDEIDFAILKVIKEFNGNKPVGFQSIDRMLLLDFEDFIFSGKLGKKLKQLQENSLIFIATEKGGYLLTEEGNKLIENR